MSSCLTSPTTCLWGHRLSRGTGEQPASPSGSKTPTLLRDGRKEWGEMLLGGHKKPREVQ